MKREGGVWATAAVLGIAATFGVSKGKSKPSLAPVAYRADRPVGLSAQIAAALEKEPCSDWKI